LARAAGILSQYFSLRAQWLTDGLNVAQLTGGVVAPADHGPGTWPIILLLAAITAALAWRTQRRALATLLAVLGGFIVVAWVSIAAILGPAYPYLLIWVDVLSLTTAVASVTGLLLIAVSNRAGPDSGVVTVSKRTSALVAIGCALVATAVCAQAIMRAPNPYDDRAPVVRELSDQLRKRYSEAEPIWFNYPGNQEARTFITALMVQLEKDGHRTTATLDERLGLGVDRTKGGPAGDTELIVAEGASIEEIAKDPANERVAYVDEFTAAERVRLAELEAAVEEVRNNPGTDEFTRDINAAVVAELLQFRGNRLRVAVFEHHAEDG
jgi:hypothetical protein